MVNYRAILTFLVGAALPFVVAYYIAWGTPIDWELARVVSVFTGAIGVLMYYVWKD